MQNVQRPALAFDSTQSDTEVQSKYLSDISAKDKPWDSRRSECDTVQGIYARAEQFERYAERMSECSGLLEFNWIVDTGTGESNLKLHRANFCRVRHCPVCQWRRTLMWQAKFLQSLPQIQSKAPKGSRWLFLTLTVKNCPVHELRGVLSHMSKSWQRLIKRKQFKNIIGFVRSTEITRGDDGSAHPHYHVLMLVQSTYFSGHNYVKQSEWVTAWQSAARLDYVPIVDIRAVKSKKPKKEKVTQSKKQLEALGLRKAISETLKYSVKPSDMTANDDWFLQMTAQVHKLRFIATGGLLKKVLKPETEITDKDMIMLDEDDKKIEFDENGLELNEIKSICYGWRREEKRYKKTNS